MQKPDRQSFEEILEDNKERIYRICRIYAVAPNEPQDLFQEVVYQVWKSLDSFQGNSGISTWIYRIALNVCMRSKMKLEKKNIKTTRLESIQFDLTRNDKDLVEDERYRALHSCISSLNEGDKSLVVLYLDDLPYKEIASITGLSENHVAVKMKRIRKTLLECISRKLN